MLSFKIDSAWEGIPPNWLRGRWIQAIIACHMTIKRQQQDKNPVDDWHLSNGADEELYNISKQENHTCMRSPSYSIGKDLQPTWRDLGLMDWDNGKHSGEHNSLCEW